MFTKWLFLFSIMNVAICESKFTIEVKKQDGSPELGKAAIKMVTTCYKNHDKTVVLMGDFPGQYIEGLSSHESFSLVLMDNRRRTKTITNFLGDKNPSIRWHKVNVVVITVSHVTRLSDLFDMYVGSVYSNPLSAFLILGWSAQNKHAACDGQRRTFEFMTSLVPGLMLNSKMMCWHRTNNIIIYHSNFFTNEVPEPWRCLAVTHDPLSKSEFRMLAQIFRGNVGMCKNLDFDKTKSVGRFPVKLILTVGGPTYANLPTNDKYSDFKSRWLAIESAKRTNPIYTLLKHLNATIIIVEQSFEVIRSGHTTNWDGIEMRPTILKSIQKSNRDYDYPFRQECSFIVTQFRGNKSQLRKILDVIDIYSWIGISTVYIVTLIFFKYFFHQHIIEGILNLVRLSSSMGLTILPSNLSPKIYFSCLLFFVVTIQGIFLGNLAALLTQDIPVRQVNSLQDLLELGYTVYVDKINMILFDQPPFKGRVIEKLLDEDCISLVQENSSVATTIIGAPEKEYVLQLNLYVSSTCFENEYYSHVMPYFWSLKERYEELMSRMFAADILTPFDMMVDEKRLIEFQSQVVDPIPRVMNLGDLTFAFVLLGIGLSVAILVFIAEITFFRFQTRIKKTRVIVLN